MSAIGWEKVRTLGALSTATEQALRKRIAELEAAVATAQGELATVRGAMKADDERLRTAGERVGLYFDCDTPEHMADEIEALRKRVGRLRAGLIQVCHHAGGQCTIDVSDHFLAVYVPDEVAALRAATPPKEVS